MILINGKLSKALEIKHLIDHKYHNHEMAAEMNCCGQPKVFNFQGIRKIIIDKVHGGNSNIEMVPRFLRSKLRRQSNADHLWQGPRRNQCCDISPLMCL